MIRVGSQPPGDGTTDLTDETAFTLRLLEDTWLWRQRLVEEVDLGDAHHVRVESAYQIEFPPGLVDEFVESPRARRAKVILPITTRPKRPLSDFSAAGPGGSPALLHRRSATAEVQAEYLGRLLDEHGTDQLRSVLDPLTLEAICVFTPGPVRLGDRSEPTDAAVAAYLSRMLGIEVPPVDVSSLFARTASASERLCGTLDEAPDLFSAAERFVFALVAVAVLTETESRPQNRDELVAVLDSYNQAVTQAAPTADVFLKALAEYGRRWEVLLDG